MADTINFIVHSGEYPVIPDIPEDVEIFAEPQAELTMHFCEVWNNFGYPGYDIDIISAAPPVQQTDYICVYDMQNPQLNFDNNGLCILMPTVCEITEELNGAYELLLEHPIDPEGRWTFLRDLNIIKANGQLFRIYRRTTKLNSDGSKSRVVNARHIFYDLNDMYLDDVRPEDKNGQDFIGWIMTHVYTSADEEYNFPEPYSFSWHSDISNTATAYYQMMSPVAALIGEDNCFINRLGGELHRDNFYFSIDTKKEGSVENAFNIRYGMDMLDVEEIVDYSDFCTTFIGKDNYASKVMRSYLPNCAIAHSVTKGEQFNYESFSIDDLRQDVKNYFEERMHPKISYKVTYADLKNVEMYKDFIDIQHCNVGDTGLIYCEELQISTTQKIVKKTVDVLTGNTVSIELGNLSASLTRWDRYSGTISSGSAADKAAAASAEEARKAKISQLTNWQSAKDKYVWGDLLGIKYKEVKK